MFEQTFVEIHEKGRRPWTMAASLTAQTGLVGLLLLIPLLHPEGPFLRVDAPPLIYRTNPLPPAPDRVAIPASRHIAVRVPNIFGPVLRAPRAVPTTVAEIHDAPEVLGFAAVGSNMTGVGLDTILGALPGHGSVAPSPRVVTPVAATAPAAAPLRISTSVQAANLLFGPKPAYPPLARATRQQGKVRLTALIGTDGSIRNLRLISGPPLLVRAAMDSIQQWRYRPTLLNGQPVEVITEIEVNFTLTQ